MKKKLMALMILSILSSIGLILLIVGGIEARVTYSPLYGYATILDHLSIWYSGYAIFGCVLFVGTGIAQFILAIIVLATKNKVVNGNGLVIASGILGLLWGVFFVGAIVSGIAFAKVTESEKINDTNSSNKSESSELRQMRQELEELKKAHAENETAKK